MLKNRSVATIDAPEFIDVTPYNPLISECTIKVFYLGRNRNGSYIDKNTAIQMANSLPCAPIVAAWREDIENFGDHGHVVTIEDGEVKFACKTVPYGFVAPDARVWFQKFRDIDEFGNEVEREYLMTTGYLWTGQYPEVQKVIDEGSPQSMELDEGSMNGHWANDSKTGMDFFIINDATFSKLCILGDDVEPCFEGASVTGVETSYAQGAEFASTLYTMMKQLENSILAKEGGLIMPEKQETVEETVATDFVAANGTGDEKKPEQEAPEKEAKPEQKTEEPEKKEEKKVPTESVAKKDEEQTPSEEPEPAAEPEKKDEEKPVESKKRECALEDEKKEEVQDGPAEQEDKKEKPVDSKKRECSLGEANFSLVEENERLRHELDELLEFKRSIESREKDALIAKYHMLSDEDKASVIEHKDEYSLEQIDEKLALIYVKKNVDFSTVDGHKEEETEDVESLLNFSLDDNAEAEVVTDIQAALRNKYNY